MAGIMSFTDQPDFLELVNRILEMATIPPVTQLVTISNLSDAALAHKKLISIIRAEASRGWWFNSTIEQKFTVASGGVFTIVSAISGKESANSFNVPCQPRLRLRSGNNGTSEALVVNIDDNTTSFVEGDEYWMDVIYLPDPTMLPVQFLDYCMYKAGRQFAASVGIKISTDDEVLAFDLLDKAESEFAPTPNRNNNPEIYTQVQH